MAKNLKLNIKNAQLAEALKLNAPKKKTPITPKEEEKQIPEPIAQTVQEKPQVVSAPIEQTPIKEPTIQKIPEDQAPPSRIEAPSQKPTTFSKPSYPQRPREFQGENRFEHSPRQNSEGRSFSRPGQGYPPRPEGSAPRPPGQRPPYNQNPRPPYSQNNSSSYGQNPRPPGQRPPYNQNPRPPYGQNSRPPYGQNNNSSYGPRPPGQRPPYNQNPRPPGQRPPFRRESDAAPSDFRRPSFPPPVRDQVVKEIPQQHQVHKKSQPQGGEFPKKTQAGKEVKEKFSFDARDRQGLRSGEDDVWRKRKIIKTKHQQSEEVNRPKELKVRLPIMLKDLAAEMKLKASQLIAKLFMQGVVLTLNDYLDDETTIQLLGHEFECEISIDSSEEERVRVTDKTIKQEIVDTESSLLQLRPPVVTFMGHVDHGKTSLIDTIRKSNVASTEAGAITQHIGAFKCHTQVGELTILDTPGHEAFSAMRGRGADVTDIVVLVVAGDEGIRAQTLEAISQAKSAGVSLVVALNKCDKPGFNPENVYRQLADQNLLPESWGGSVITVNCSALTGEGIKELLEMLALQAEVLELKANSNTRARGSVIESEMHKGLGTVATLLVQNGTLKVGDALVFDQFYAKVKTMHDEHGKELTEAPPSTPVKITGLSGVPGAGSEFIAVKSEKEARDISEKRKEDKKGVLLQQKRGSLENLLQDRADSKLRKTLNLILKADVQGSLDALKTSLRKIPSTKVDLAFISEGVGEISESDIQLAATSKAVILGFHTQIESHAEMLIRQTKVQICMHDIIYHAVDDIKAIMLTKLDKIAVERDTGSALVKAVFKSSQLGNIAGCQISDGFIKRNHHAKLLRSGEQIWKGPISSLKRGKEDVKELQKGYECGILLQGFSDFKENDIIQAYEISYLEPVLE